MEKDTAVTEYEALTSAVDGDDEPSVSTVQNAIELGAVVWDTEFAHVRVVKKEDVLLYHVFRGEQYPRDLWGAGDFGVLVKAAADTNWSTDKPHTSFVGEAIRPEVYADNPKLPPKFPDHYYGAYSVVVLGIARKPLLSDKKIAHMCRLLEEACKASVKGRKNGG